MNMRIMVRIRRLVGRGIDYLYGFLPDSWYLQRVFPKYLGYPLDLNNPQTYNAKLQWLKLNNRHPEYSKLVDKYEVKDYVKRKAGDRYVIPTLGVWNGVDELNFDDLPQQFVLKCTHDSGSVVICSNKSDFDIKKAKKILKRGLQNKNNFAIHNKEYPYKYVKPRIIAEQYMDDGMGLIDYKFFCFDGEPRFLFVATDRNHSEQETKFDFFDMDWNHLPVTNGHPNNPNQPNKPKNFDEMVKVASTLSQGIPHVRVDLYNIKGRVYFGELTFFHWSGLVPFKPKKWDYEFGNYLVLPEI